MLKIKDNIDLKELEKYEFKKMIKKDKTHKYQWKNGKEEYYTEIVYSLDNGVNTIDIVEKRENSDWKHTNKEREIYIYESDYDMGVSKGILDILYDLIQAGLVEKVSD